MLLISPHPQYQLVGITDEEPVYHPTNGRLLKTVPGIDAEFFHGGAPSWACEQALANSTFQGAWQGLPDGVDYRAYISSYNTDDAANMHGWDADTKKFVEDFLLNHPDCGRYYTVAVPPSEIQDLPWPSYNETHHSRVLIEAQENGVPIQDVYDYEVKHKARPFVVGKLIEALDGAEPAPVDELVPA